MNRRWMLAGVVGYLAAGPAIGAGEPETVTIRGQEHRVWPAKELRARGFDVPEVPREQNAAWTYIEAINAYEEVPASLEDAFSYAHGTAWPAGHVELTEHLKLPASRRAMEFARRAAAMDRCQMPYFGDARSSVLSLLLPNLSGMRQVGKLLVAEGKRLESEGNADEATRNYLASMRMGAHVAEGVTLIEGLVGLSLWALADRALVDMVLRRPLSATQLQSIHMQLSGYASQLPTVQRGLEGERAFGPAIVQELCARPLWFMGTLRGMSGSSPEGEEFPIPDGSGNPTDGWGRLELRIGQLILPDRAITQHMLGYYDKVIDRARKGPREAAASDFDDERYVTETIPRWDVVSRMLLPSLARATLLGERAKADLALLRTIVAIRLHMLEHYGKPPASLAELEDRLPREAMIDPFSANLLVYRRDGDGWILYSLGPDLVDDGGQKGSRWDKLDMVHQLPPEPVEPFGKHDE